ncbi:ankyrin repeat domain-containing protein 31 isoform X9 [Gorilla gorilla gorilla]|uniref:ankyrin repeat domain-containing protein 31 isoform X9 n=1 Tax=Gorilla gorilla gorilla TaxID=9595 RepID=UPI003007F992
MRLLFDQDASLKSEFGLHPDTRGMCKGMPSPEIQLGFKLREDLQEQMNKNKMMPVLSEDTVLQQSQDETERNQALLQTRKNCSMFIGSFRQSGLSLNHQNIEGPEAESPEVLPHIEKTPQDPNPSGLQTLAHQNITSCEPLSNKRNSNSVTNSSDQETACVLRRSSRLEKLKVSRDAKYSDHMYKMPEKILPKILGCEDLTNNNSSAQNFRMQDPALMIDGKEKNMHSARFKNGKQIRKNEQFSGKKEKMKVNKISLGSINRRNIFGENLVYKAALHDDADLVHRCIKKGGNVNQPSYAGWTALHEASVGGFYRTASELLKGGADVNIKGIYQITPLHDAVMNGHYKVAELLLLNGADPLFRNDDGKCALDEAKDLCMKRLLERYIPKHQKCLTSAQRSSIDPLDIEDVYQHKKPKFSSKSHIWHVYNENSNRQKLEHVKVNKGSKESLFINKEDVYEYYQKDPKNTKFGKSKHKQSTLNQIYSTGLRKGNLHNVKDPNTNVPKGIGRRKTQHKRTQVDDVDCNPRKTLAVSPSRRINRLVTYQQHIPETHNDLPEELCEPSSLTLSSLKNGLDSSTEACSVSKEIHIQNLDLSDSQEVQCLELESVDQTEAVSFPGLLLHKEIKLPVVTTDKQPHTLQEQHRVLYKSHENSNLVPKDERFNKWENSFLSFVKGNSDNDGDDDCSTSEKAITSKKVLCSTGGKKHYNFKENLTNKKEMGFQQFLLSEDHLSQENELKAVSLTTLPEQEAVNFSHSDNAVISEHVANYEQCIFGPSFDHSNGNPEQNSLACMRTLLTHEASKLTNHVELFKKPQDYIPRAPTFLMNQTDTHIVEKVAKNCDTERNYIDRDQKIIYSNEPLSIVVHSQVIETTEVEKRRQNHLESETIHDIDSHSTDNMSKELANISKLSQREKKEISHKPGMKTGGINKRNARGESQLHLAARRGNLSLVKALIESGADVNLNDNAGWTPLHEASNEGSIDIIVELLKAGAKVNCENIDGILPLHDAVANNHLKHQTLSAVLQDIEEKQEYLLEFEIRNPEDAEQYIEKMLKIKKIMDNVLAKQKAERDDLAKKYRVSIESFKHGALREQLANLAARQKSLLVVAKKQKKISLKIQNCKNVTSLPCLSLRKLPPRSEISSEKDSQELTTLENLEHPQSGSLSPVSGSMQETQLSPETWNYSQNTNVCLNSEAVRRGEFSGNDMNSKQNVSDCTLDGFPKSRHSDGTEKNKLPSQPVAFIGQTEYSQKENDLTEATDKDHEFYVPSPVIGKLNISETASVLAENAAHPSNIICDQDLSNYDPKRGNRKTSSQQSPTGASESLAHQGIAVLGSDTVHQMKPYLKKPVSVVPCADDSQISSSSGSGQQDTIKKPLNYSTAPKKKCIQIKDLILLGRINPGNNILEFKTQETTHKASILLNGKLKVESGQIYKNPVTWLKDLLGGNSYVTWNYAWSKVTYLGKELLKYVSEDAPILPEPNSVPQQYQPCLPEVACLDDPVQEPNKSMFEKTKFGQGTSRESLQSIPRYLQINEILLISDQEFLPCHIMDQHWKFCVESEELTP